MQDAADRNASAVPLRERRRQQTECEIQEVVLKLSAEHGFANVTTEMIAAAAGISQRTFFNYFANKEAALIGRPIEFDAALLDWFAGSTRPLGMDVMQLISDHCRKCAPRKELIRAIVALTEDQPQLGMAFIESLRRQAVTLSAAISRRLGPDSRALAEHLSDTIIRAIGLTFYDWAHHPEQTLGTAIANTQEKLRQIGRIICGQGSTC